MGSATYYLKAKFPKKITEKKFQAIRNFFIEGSKAADYWQSNRGKTPDQFWPDFEKQFPEVTTYLKGLELFGKDCNNALAGQIDFGEQEDIEDNMTYEGNLLTYHAEVWHFAQWDPILKYLKGRYGAVQTGYVSDEYVEETSYYYDAIGLD